MRVAMFGPHGGEFEELTCKQCGLVFTTYVSDKRKFCSHSCADKHHGLHLNSGAFKKGCKSFVRTKEYRDKMSKLMKGRKCPWNVGRNKMTDQRGSKNPNYKHGKTKNNRCVDCGTRIWFSFTRCKSCANRGENNPRYIDGRTQFERSLRNTYDYKQWKERVLQRDKGICQECGSGDEIEVHHKVSFGILCSDFIVEYNRLNLKEDRKVDLAKWYYPLWDIDNGITLCVSCHKEVDVKRRQYA